MTIERSIRLAGSALAAGVLLITTAAVQADITLSSAGDEGVIDGAIFYAPNVTHQIGNSQAFLDMRDSNDANSLEFGFNTTTGTNQSAPAGTEDTDYQPSIQDSLLLSEIPILTVGGVAYREFALAVNQEGNSPVIKLTDLEIRQSNSAAIVDKTAFDALSLVFAMTSMDVIIHDIHGGVNIDMVLLVKDSLFSNSFTNVVMFAGFSDANDGPERWAANRGGSPFVVDDPPNGPHVTTEPGMLGLLGFGLVGLAMRRRRRAA